METSGGIQASLPVRYAIALFDLARNAKAIDTVESTLAAGRAALNDSADFARLTTSPLVSRADAKKAVAATATALKL
ncbi:F0F1 ATP synthase subunit delta, partial [Acinetobacter baumannii]